jgi:hypothetical protein
MINNQIIDHDLIIDHQEMSAVMVEMTRLINHAYIYHHHHPNQSLDHDHHNCISLLLVLMIGSPSPPE